MLFVIGDIYCCS